MIIVIKSTSELPKGVVYRMYTTKPRADVMYEFCRWMGSLWFVEVHDRQAP